MSSARVSLTFLASYLPFIQAHYLVQLMLSPSMSVRAKDPLTLIVYVSAVMLLLILL